MREQDPLSSPLRLHSDDEAQIAALAYRFYCEEGCPGGRRENHWLRAEQQVRGQTGSAKPETPSTEPAPGARPENPPLEE